MVILDATRPSRQVSESVRVASVAAAVAAAPIAAGVVMQVWQQMQQHLAAIVAQTQQQQHMLQQSRATGLNPHPHQQQQPGLLPPGGFPTSVPAFPALPSLTAAEDRGTVTLPSFSIDPWTWQQQHQQQPQQRQIPSTDPSKVAASVQYFGGGRGEVYCCYQGKWFQVRPATVGDPDPDPGSW